MGRQSSLMLFSGSLSLGLMLVALLPAQAEIQSRLASQNPTLPGHSVFQVTFEPPGDGKPDNTVGGASRDSGQCLQDAITSQQTITPLMPTTNRGLTLVERPTFFVYVPQTSAQKAFFSLKDKDESYYYQATLPMPETSGIVSLKLPADAPALEIGKSYQWSFVTICGERLAVDDPRVESQIQRIELNTEFSSQLKNLSPLERAAVYGADGIWYDTVATLAELRRSQPNDLTLAATWENLLKSVGLNAIATKPLLQ
ncbi:MAG: DUF928 domain-containing protein [Symplocastrum torsivum CPER-KK1]|uniref:DUF928 domain-containing protein n=1 Tax=Symplocastrum torsivum CPER-KK1 TaxID=450513 RepID=A0A951UBQ7_9CYAN|nr:DUF928 domain-containing protein [Symplocastrum torsivum CPER-KK1]